MPTVVFSEYGSFARNPTLAWLARVVNCSNNQEAARGSIVFRSNTVTVEIKAAVECCLSLLPAKKR